MNNIVKIRLFTLLKVFNGVIKNNMWTFFETVYIVYTIHVYIDMAV